MNAPKIIKLTLPVRGTGSYIFENRGNSKGTLQMYKAVGSTTVESVTPLYSNYSNNNLPNRINVDSMLTASTDVWTDAPTSAPDSGYWAIDNSLTGSFAFLSASAAPASVAVPVDGFSSKWLRIDVCSKTGGEIHISWSRTGR